MRLPTSTFVRAVLGVVHSNATVVVGKKNYRNETLCTVHSCSTMHTLLHSQPQIQPRSLVQGRTALRSVTSPSNRLLPTHSVSATRSTPAHSSSRSQNREHTLGLAAACCTQLIQLFCVDIAVDLPTQPDWFILYSFGTLYIPALQHIICCAVACIQFVQFVQQHFKAIPLSKTGQQESKKI